MHIFTWRKIFISGELEFSDQDAFSPGGHPHEVRVKPPPGFLDSVDFIDQMEKKNNPGIFELKQKPTTSNDNAAG